MGLSQGGIQCLSVQSNVSKIIKRSRFHPRYSTVHWKGILELSSSGSACVRPSFSCNSSETLGRIFLILGMHDDRPVSWHDARIFFYFKIKMADFCSKKHILSSCMLAIAHCIAILVLHFNLLEVVFGHFFCIILFLCHFFLSLFLLPSVLLSWSNGLAKQTGNC